MKKVGDYWLPDQDMRWGSNRRKSKAAYAHGGRGEQIHHLEDALASVPRRTTAIDVGANIGAYVRLLAEAFDHVVAIEPAADAAACLRRNIADWGVAERVTVHEIAASDRDERVAMEAEPGRRTLTRHVTPGGDIPALPIDRLAVCDVAFLKLDVEGYEERALHGARQTILRDRPVIMMEVKVQTDARYGRAMAAHTLVESLGYRLLRKIGAKEIDWLYAPG
ncbi:FkbM family methyltransferase [Acuticoccus sp. I52.16.1]|uniref:FkbM family methyltransferase n=1 Tax=Acuticoccus sp. I52.16.1 TaxID=2928472 RepID=UPI001FD3FD32|nr:FkbM family methyltransferase [Acuticoccus sp. I52.16.1]UOM34836.1 FkbM family methyltransferase [Acuticoccus sp. I52.16.1]